MCLPGHHGAAAVRGEGTGALVQRRGFGCSSPMRQGRVLMNMGELLGHTPGRMGQHSHAEGGGTSLLLLRCESFKKLFFVCFWVFSLDVSTPCVCLVPEEERSGG